MSKAQNEMNGKLRERILERGQEPVYNFVSSNLKFAWEIVAQNLVPVPSFLILAWLPSVRSERSSYGLDRSIWGSAEVQSWANSQPKPGVWCWRVPREYQIPLLPAGSLICRMLWTPGSRAAQPRKWLWEDPNLHPRRKFNSLPCYISPGSSV